MGRLQTPGITMGFIDAGNGLCPLNSRRQCRDASLLSTLADRRGVRDPGDDGRFPYRTVRMAHQYVAGLREAGKPWVNIWLYRRFRGFGHEAASYDRDLPPTRERTR